MYIHVREYRRGQSKGTGNMGHTRRRKTILFFKNKLINESLIL
jgi:hypothetical protein